MTSAPQAVIFDWDNTLVDSWPVILDSLNTTLSAMGHAPWTLEESRLRVARSLRDAFPELFGPRWEEARDIFYARFKAIHLESLALMPGAQRLLDSLTARGTYLAVVSNKTGEHLRAEAAHLKVDRYFARIIGALDAPRDKPAADPVHMALARSGIVPGASVWFVGDAAVDLQCAINAGCMPVLMRAEPPIDDEFPGHRPRLHFSSLEDLETLVAAR